MSTPISPAHYKSDGSFEAIDVIEKFDLPFRLANVFKYIVRAGKKGERNQDLEKAIAYLWRERYGEWPVLPDNT